MFNLGFVYVKLEAESVAPALLGHRLYNYVQSGNIQNSGGNPRQSKSQIYKALSFSSFDMALAVNKCVTEGVEGESIVLSAPAKWKFVYKPW